MDEPERRISFTEAWLADLQEDVRTHGKRKLFPWKVSLCLLVGYLVSRLISVESFWSNQELTVAFFAAILTFNGLLLAFSWSGFAKIYEIAASPHMSEFLRRHKLLNMFIFIVDYIHYAQIFALAMSSAALVLCVSQELPDYFPYYISIDNLRHTALILTIGSSIYALSYALGAVSLMQDLMWYSSQLANKKSDRGLTIHEGGRKNGD